MQRHGSHGGRSDSLRSTGGDTFAPPAERRRCRDLLGRLFCLCAGAVNSAVILLASANDKHPNGLANSSDQVGRNFMYHQADALLAISTERNEDTYTKTWGTNDFYLKDTDPAYPFPLGQVQPVGSFHSEMMKGDAPPLTPGFVLETMKHHAVPWWLTTEDLPDPGQSRHPAQHDAARRRKPSAGPWRPASLRRHGPHQRVRAGFRQRPLSHPALLHTQ